MELNNRYWWGFSNRAWLELACEGIGGVVIGEHRNHPGL